MDGVSRPQQWRMAVGNRCEVCCGRADHCLLRRVRPRRPLVKRQCVPRRSKDRPAIDQRRGGIEAQPHPFDKRGEGPGIDRLAVGRGLPAHRIEPGAVGPGSRQRMAQQRRIEARDCGRGMFEGYGERRRGRSEQPVI